jgi:hypothetical protein
LNHSDLHLTGILVRVFLGIALGVSWSPSQTRGDELKYSVRWIGNSFPGAQKWVQQDIRAVLVTGDGTVYTNAEWDEAGREVGVYRDGDVLGLAGHTHGWGYHGGRAIAVNDQYVFIAQKVDCEGGGLKDPETWPAKSKVWYGVARRKRSDITRPAPFPGGKGGKGDTLKGGFLVVNEVPDHTKGDLVGLWATPSRLYVSNPLDSAIQVYDAETMATLQRWPLERTGPLAMDAAGTLWVLQAAEGNQQARIVRLDAHGKRLPQQVTFPPEAVPVAFCFDSQGRLLVADDGVNQQIRIYSQADTNPTFSGTFGQTGGIYADVVGKVGALRFNRPSGIGCDEKGNLYVANSGSSGGGSAVLESYTPDGKRRWQLLGLEFVDMADVDPDDDTQVYTKEERFRLDYRQPAGQDWTYESYTIHPFRYPDDPRLHLWSAGAWVRRIQGKPYLFVTDMNAQHLQVYRFAREHDGEIAIPSGLFAGRHLRDKAEWPPQQPDRGEWIWRDVNGDGRLGDGEYQVHEGRDLPSYQGWWVDTVGNVWQATETGGIRQFPLEGIDQHGNPIWSYASMRLDPHPKELKQLKRLRYLPQEDVMYLGGTTAEHANQHWKPMGPVICRYDDWSRPQRKLRWQIVAPYEKGSSGHSSCEPMGFDVADEYLFVPYTGASKSLGYRTGHIEVFRGSDGRSVGFMEPPAEVGEIGLQDIRECLRAHRRADGEYLIFLEEDWKAKILLYRWKPGRP